MVAFVLSGSGDTPWLFMTGPKNFIWDLENSHLLLFNARPIVWSFLTLLSAKHHALLGFSQILINISSTDCAL